MELFYLLLILSYVLLLWSLKQHWLEKNGSPCHRDFRGKITVLVPFRNEAEQLPRLLLNLEEVCPDAQEVIFVDDASTDGSAPLISDFIEERKQGLWVLLVNAGVGKKAALTTGVNYTDADVVLTTDADCILPEFWIDHMTKPFYDDKMQLVAGPVLTVTRDGFFSRFQQIEWASILLMTKYLFAIERPVMCSGANLAYRKSAFVAVEGYLGNEMHPSGDDEFLLEKIIQKYGVDSVTYVQAVEALVKTQPLSTWAGFLQQRIRWAGKWRLHGPTSILPSVMAFVLASLEISTLFLLSGAAGAWLTFFVFWTVKVSIEKHVLGKVLADYQIGHSLSCFIKTSFLHPVYIILVGVRAIFGKYSWKGRDNDFKV